MQFYLDRKFYGTHKADPKNKPIALHVVMLKKEQFVKKKKKKKKKMGGKTFRESHAFGMLHYHYIQTYRAL